MNLDVPKGSLLEFDLLSDVALLRLNRPDQGNALNGEIVAELDEATRWLLERPGVRAVVLTGAGKCFCVGADLAEQKAALERPDLRVQEHNRRELRMMIGVVRNFQTLRCPVIAAVNGQAAGAGFALALATDIRIADRRASFNFAYAGIGASTDGGMSWFLPRIVGHARAVELLYEQPVLRSADALALGLVNKVAEEGNVLAEALDYARDLASKAPHSMANAKKMLRMGWQLPFEEHLEVETDTFHSAAHTADLLRGINARLAGEWPVFLGD